MKISAWSLVICLALISCTRQVYVVRHAEKVSSGDSLSKMMANNPPLSEAGKVRAIVLRDELKNKHIAHIYSTNTVRAMSTAAPLSESIHVQIEQYSSVDSLVHTIRSVKGNVLVVGHSNTVDDIVNKLCGTNKLTDLKDNTYDDLFVIKLTGNKGSFAQRKYGYPSNP